MKLIQFNWMNAVVLAWLLCCAQQARAQVCQDAAELLAVEGSVEILRVAQPGWAPVEQGDSVCIGDVLRSGSFSRAALLLANDTVVRLDQDTTLTFVEPQDEQKSWLELLEGLIHVISRDANALKVITPYANAGVEGTEFSIGVRDNQTDVTVLEGTVNLQNDVGEVRVDSGQTAAARAGQSPIIVLAVAPRDAVRWAMYFVPVLDSGVSPSAADRPGDPAFYTARAASRLGVGRVDEAEADIAVALKLDPNDADAFALQSAIAVTLNRPDEALAYAQQAQAADPSSAAAAIAMSYARQAVFDLNGALRVLVQAAADNPDNALVMARLAEVQLALGLLRAANQSAERAVALNPGLALTQTVQGFAALTELRLRSAEAAFRQAIAIDQAAPLPRLGLGLTLIRTGQLAAGREQIEIAVLLDPNNSLVRSYMGKAYYEEKRNGKAGEQYGFAKELDPRDPTPWFYDSILLQTTNRPVEALRNQQRSIELNDNRAVYRSRLLLDQDLAARSAALGRIYRNLGFKRLAQVEGAKSVNADPGDFSGHRFLADIYSELPRHEIARVNELYQSQLLQPISLTPVQPQLGQGNIFILDTAGPNSLAYNEFNPLFNRNRLAFQGSAVLGSNETKGADAVVSGVWNGFSFSLGGFDFQTDGFRENNDIDQRTGNVLVQIQASARTSFLGEFRTNEVEKGDLRLPFYDDFFNDSLRQKEDVESARLGFRHGFVPGSQLIGSYLHENLVQETSTVLPNTLVLDVDVERDRDKVELQHLLQRNSWRLTSGASYLKDDRTSQRQIGTFVSPPSDSENDFLAAYVYSGIYINDQFELILGGSLNDLDGRISEKDQFNPKLGIIWEPLGGMTVRAASFRTLQEAPLSRQNVQPSLEPTQVAGFNQYYYGFEGEDVWRTAVALDQTFSASLFAGAELSTRRREVPLSGNPDVANIDEDFARAYLSWAISDQFAFNAEYRYEDFDSDAPTGAAEQAAAKVRTHRLPLELTWFHPSGLSAGFKATWVDQEGDFGNANPPPDTLPGDDRFWVADAVIGYRLPGRYGLLSIQVNNLTDETFNFQDVDPENPELLPERFVAARMTVNF